MASNAERVSRHDDIMNFLSKLKLPIQYVNFKRYNAIKLFNFEII